MDLSYIQLLGKRKRIDDQYRNLVFPVNLMTHDLFFSVNLPLKLNEKIVDLS